jgi:hypothetical protein
MAADLAPPVAAGGASGMVQFSSRAGVPARKQFVQAVRDFYKAVEPRVEASGEIKLSPTRTKAAAAAMKRVASLGVGWTDSTGAVQLPDQATFVANLEAMWSLAVEANAGAGLKPLDDADLAVLAKHAGAVLTFGVEPAPLSWVGPSGAVSITTHAADQSATRKSVYLGGIAPGVDEETIATACSAYGKVAAVQLLAAKDLVDFKREGRPVPTGLPAGQAMVTFEGEASVEQLGACRFLAIEDERVTALAVRDRAASDCRGWSAVRLDASSATEAKALWSTLPAKLKLYFLSPLGDFDATAFAFAVARLSDPATAFMTHVSATSADAFAVPAPDASAKLWSGLHPVLQSMGRSIWPTAAERNLPLSTNVLGERIASLAAVEQRGVDTDELERIMGRFDFAKQWALDRPSRVPLVYNYNALWGKVAMVSEFERDVDGNLVDEADVAKVELIRTKLPQDLQRQFANASTGDLAAALVELHTEVNLKKETYPFADEQYELWEFLHGSDPVPIDRALAFFTEGEPLVTMAELEAEHRYIYPNNLKAMPNVGSADEEPDYSKLANREFGDGAVRVLDGFLHSYNTIGSPACLKRTYV